MPLYVYALHEFTPENEDEVSFSAGERIEVIEKDDLYGDGWWQGKNLAGKTGLFPVSYTAPAPTASATPAAPAPVEPTAPDTTASGHQVTQSTSLQPLTEESEPESASQSPTAPMTDLESGPSQTNGANGYNGHEATSSHTRSLSSTYGTGGGRPRTNSEGEVMKATMTDVQHAIEQLGRKNKTDADTDGARSFSFASTRDGDQTETDTDFDTDADHSDNEAGEDWHKGARKKLAAKAKRALEEAEKLEMMMSAPGMSRSTLPPIEVELSDESEGEDDELHHHHHHHHNADRTHPHIPEEDEGEEDAIHTNRNSTNTATDRNELSLPIRDEGDLPTATTTSTFLVPQTQPPAPAFIPVHEEPQQEISKAPSPVPSEKPASTVAPPSLKAPTPPPVERISVTPPPVQATPRAPSPVPPKAPSPVPSANNLAVSPVDSQPQTTVSKPSSITSSAVLSHVPISTTAGTSAPTSTAGDGKEKSHPSDWTVDEVVEWLKGKGFDQDVCDKFIEQEITGDVLLELDVNLLKSEIGITAFGKRVRIANAITDLRRPPSIVYSDHVPSQEPSIYQNNQQHSRNQSNPQSWRSHGHTPSHGSGPHGSPISGGGQHQFGRAFDANPESLHPPGSPLATMSRDPPRASLQSYASSDMQDLHQIGLGIGPPGLIQIKNGKGRPSQLTLSPSNPDLKKSSEALSGPIDEAESGVVSEGEVVQNQSMRRRLFGRSHDSSTSKNEKRVSDPKPNVRNSKEVHSPLSETHSPISETGKDKDPAPSITSHHSRRKRSIDAKPAERLSIFANPFSGSIGKNRKPAPRYSSGSSVADPADDKASVGRFSNKKPARGALENVTTPDKAAAKKSPAEKPKAKEADTPTSPTPGGAVLKKRNDSRGNTNELEVAVAKPADTSGQLKAGQSILEQIGEFDHAGFMRKKSDRYNSWKMRYFVLKGPHLYFLKSNNKSETRIKGYVNILGYRVIADENLDPGRYGFKIVHESDKEHMFSSDEKPVIREWMKSIMKGTIGRDYTKPVISSVNIPTIPLMVAQAMNPAPRPPSPTARDATQKALRRENPNQLSSRDARVLMGLPTPAGELKENERARLDEFFAAASTTLGKGAVAAVPPRPSRDHQRRTSFQTQVANPADAPLIEWANSHLPNALKIDESRQGPLCGGLALLRIAESIKGRPSSPPVPDSAFPTDPNDDKLDGLFRLFDFLLDNDVKMGTVSINDVRQGKQDKILQLLRALKAWEDKRRALVESIGKGSVSAGQFVAPVGW